MLTQRCAFNVGNSLRQVKQKENHIACNILALTANIGKSLNAEITQLCA